MAFTRIHVIFILSIVILNVQANKKIDYCRDYSDKCKTCTEDFKCYCHKNNMTMTLPCTSDGFIEMVNTSATNYYCPSKSGELNMKCTGTDCKNKTVMMCKNVCLEISIEDIFTSNNCKQNNYTTELEKMILLYNQSLEMKSIGNEHEVIKLPWHYWVLVALNIFQLSIIVALLAVGFTAWKRKDQNFDIKVTLENDFEMIENDMYGVTAEEDASK